jgi:hypothetical protein
MAELSAVALALEGRVVSEGRVALEGRVVSEWLN